MWCPSKAIRCKNWLRTDYLIENFAVCLDAFGDGREIFDGPSLYFHQRAIQGFNNVHLVEKVTSRNFNEMVYATLASWGMHRMGDTATKMRYFMEIFAEQDDVFKSITNFSECSIRDIPVEIGPILMYGNDPVKNYHEINISDDFKVNFELLINKLRVSQSNSHLVANSKWLHHLLPNLVVPVDRQYTIKFMGIPQNALNPTFLTSDVFFYIYAFLAYVAQQKNVIDIVDSKLENPGPWDTSVTKIIDNAIIGAVKLGDYKNFS